MAIATTKVLRNNGQVGQVRNVQATQRGRSSMGYWAARTIATNSGTVQTGQSIAKGPQGVRVQWAKGQRAGSVTPHPFPVVSTQIHKPYPQVPGYSRYATIKRG